MDNSIETFKQFVDFIKNVDSYSKIADQLKKTTEDHKKALDLLTQGKTLKVYGDHLDAIKNRLTLERQTFDVACQAQNEVLAQRAKDLNIREEELNQLKVDLDKTKESLNDYDSKLSAWNNDLSKKESDLNSLIAQNNQVAEDLARRRALINQAAA